MTYQTCNSACIVQRIARLLLADFASEVVAIAAQPFLLRAPAGGRVRRHVPDFLLIHADQTVRVVNVKPAERLADPAVAEALAWPGELFEARGWGHEIWTGAWSEDSEGGSLTAAPAAVDTYRRLDVFVRGTDGNLWHTFIGF